MRDSKQAASAATCDCGSGLRRDLCCALDLAARSPESGEPAALDAARADLVGGKLAEGERRLLSYVEKFPCHPAGLLLLHELRALQGNPSAEILLARAVRLEPNNLPATQALAMLLFNRGALAEAEVHARNSVRIGPLDIQSHNLMGLIMTEAERPQVGEYHYRRAMELHGAPHAVLMANLAWNLRNQGRIAESRQLYEEALNLDPTLLRALYGWARLEETDRNFARAAELLDRAEGLSPGNTELLLERAILHRRTGALDKAISVLGQVERVRGSDGLLPREWQEKGILLDRMGRHAEAFEAFSESKRALKKITGKSYLAADAEAMARRLTSFFIAGRAQILPRAAVRPGVPQPVFITGFPRSGTTMVEQMLSAHPDIAAGDELPVINELTSLAPRLLGSPLGYPDALSELWLGDKREGLEGLRDHYLQRARQLGVPREGVRWFTDKMPLNETHLGLIGLIFPQSPVIHMLRHPLDVVLSVFSNHMTHGFFCATELKTIAQHYVLVMNLVGHYRREMSSRYLPVRYEDLVERQEDGLRAMLEFIGAAYDPRCLNFHENRRYARTASYAQVTEKLHARSLYRYRSYRTQLEPVIPILQPVIARLGYVID
jgi:tetratricopeptide (TPR) repeat protein